MRPAWEVQRINADGELAFDIDLLDHDLRSLERARAAICSPRVTYVVANAFDMIKGRKIFQRVFDREQQGSAGGRFELLPRRYDLVYSAGLYDYVRHYPLNSTRGVTGLTRLLFNLLKPGGSLIVGNFMMPGERNRHLLSHRFMMEAYSDWKLIYRTVDEIMAFTDALPPGAFLVETMDETITNQLRDESVIGHLVITKMAQGSHSDGS